MPVTIIYNRKGVEVARLAGGADWGSDEAVPTASKRCSRSDMMVPVIETERLAPARAYAARTSKHPPRCGATPR